MADPLIVDLDDEVIARLRARAARHRRSLEEEVGVILADAVGEDRPERDFMGELRRSFAEFGGVELDIPPRTETPRVPDLPE